jgi:hypothetical protein
MTGHAPVFLAANTRSQLTGIEPENKKACFLEGYFLKNPAR